MEKRSFYSTVYSWTLLKEDIIFFFRLYFTASSHIVYYMIAGAELNPTYATEKQSQLTERSNNSNNKY